jgi:hypothetical protein
MASRNRKTTMAKIMRENRLRERRMDKEARKDARRQAAADEKERPGELAADEGTDEPRADFRPA